MRILIVNEFVELGGAEQIVKNQVEILKKNGHEVYVLCFNYGNAVPEVSDKIYKVINNRFALNKLIFNISYFLKIRKYIGEIKPDVIIVHSLFSAPFTQYRALKGYKCIQIVHDYYPVCPNTYCVKINTDKSICNGYKKENCLSECTYHDSKSILALKYCQTKRLEPIRKSAISRFISPSMRLCEYLVEYGYNAGCINNPLMDIKELPYKHIRTKKTYAYVGGINTHKGILFFMEVFAVFSKDKDIQLDIYGMVTDEYIIDEFNRLVNESAKINYIGLVPNEILRNKLELYDYVIMPSLWMENYPTSVLEAMACGTVVIGSDRGGIKEMLEDNRGILFNYIELGSLMKVLEKSYDMKENEYSLIRNNAYRYILKHNSEKEYYKRLICEIQSI